MLKIRMFTPACTALTNEYMNAAASGIRDAGDDCAWTKHLDEPCDIAFHTSGPKPFPKTNVLNEARRTLIAKYGWRRLVMESACFRQGLKSPGGKDSTYWRLSFGGFLDDEAIYHPPGFRADASRWEKIQKERAIKISPWREAGDHVLICGQKPHDSSLRGLEMHQWIREVIDALRQHTDRKIILRLHPKDPHGMGKLRGLIGPSLKISDPGFAWKTRVEEDLRNAWAMVTYTSLSAIDAICAGIPVFTLNSGNFAWPVTQHDLSQIETPATFEREPWLWDLAYRQWTTPEYAEGTPWRRLREAYFSKCDLE